MHWILLAILILFPALAAAEQASCPIQLQESQTQSLIIAQSRDVTEQQLAKALRANKELSGLYDKSLAHVNKLEKDLAELKVKAEEKKAE